MYIEKRKVGNNIKYYLTHSYRENTKIKKIRRYLGKNLSEDELNKLSKKAEDKINAEIEALNTEVFNFSLTPKQIEKFNKLDSKIKIPHLETEEWKRFTKEFTYNTNAIEGSSVLLEEVSEILKKKSVSDPEEIETKGVAKAVEFIRKTDLDLSLELIKKLHELCFKGSKTFAGKFRNVEVVIRNSRGEILHKGFPFKEIENELKEMIDWYNKHKKIFRPLPLAAIIHNQFEYIHPFQDGNGRVGRLLLNYILIKNNYPPINIKLRDRREYYSVLLDYSKNHKIKPTIKFLIKQYKKTIKDISHKNKELLIL